MNVDADYWLSLAAQWIQSKSQTQMSFPQNFPIFPIAPEPQKFSNNHSDATKNDNLVETDMELEEEKEDEPVSEVWNNWQTKIIPTTTIQSINSQQTLPVNTSNMQTAPKVAPNNKNQNNRSDQYTSKFVKVPSAPMIGFQISESSQSVDMVLDSEEEDDVNSAIMEAQKRKKLPVWIREGLERMEREKKQEALRLQKEKELQADVESRKKIMEEALKEIEREKTAKSKYDSDSDDNDEQLRNGTPETEHNANESSRLPHVQDDEDAFERMMLIVRKTLTEILLEVTDEKIQEISSETLSKYRKKASSVTSNRTVTNSLGLGVYGNSSDEESDDEDNLKDDLSDWESEAVLKERIRVKSIMFEQRAKEIKERLAKVAEAEQERFRKKDSETNDHSKTKSRYDDSDDDKPQKSKSRKIDGEEKYDQIYSISSFYATSGRQRDKKKTRFNDPKERTSSVVVTHVGMLDKIKPAADNGSTSIIAAPLLPSPEVKKKGKKRDSSSSSASSSSSGHQKKHKKHKKSSKHIKKSSKKRDRSRSRDYDRDRRKSYKSDRRSIESKSSVRSSDSKRNRSRSRSRSRHRSRRY